jgi:putative ABC transport system substrate-binding protein
MLRHLLSRAAALAICVILAPVELAAQQAVKSPARVGVLSPLAPGDSGVQRFRDRLRELGYVEKQNLIIEPRWAEGRLDRLPELARDLVAAKPDVIFALGEQSLRAAKAATADIPIVVFACDPVDKLVISLARPQGGATGVTCIHSELAGKRLGLVKDMIPPLTRVAVLYYPGDPNKVLEAGELQVAGKRLGVGVQNFEVRDADAIGPAFAAIVADRPQALMVLVDAFTVFHRKRLAEMALANRLPMVSGFKEFVEDGAVLSYGANRLSLMGRAATYVDRILKGAKPGDLPVEEPTIFELFINLKTAKALDLAIPFSFFARADGVIE